MLNRIYESYENRCFELEVAKALEKGIAKPPIYLSVGTEHIPVFLKYALKDAGIHDYVIFPQHRCHSYFLTFSENKIEAMKSLRDELRGLNTGCGKGWTGSASLHIPGKMFGHNGHLSSQTSIACGYAHASNRLTICILGDAAAESGEFLSSLGYAVSNNLNILFICEDNNLSILTPKSIRRSWNLEKVASGFGIPSENISDDFSSMLINMKKYININGTRLLNINVCRHLWHAGSGKDGPPKWDSLSDSLIKFDVDKNNIKNIKLLSESIWEDQ